MWFKFVSVIIVIIGIIIISALYVCACHYYNDNNGNKDRNTHVRHPIIMTNMTIITEHIHKTYIMIMAIKPIMTETHVTHILYGDNDNNDRQTNKHIL